MSEMDTATFSSPGGRDHNEDACGFRGGCWVVADGLGGHLGGAIASQLAVDAAMEAFDGAVTPESLATLIARANQAVLDRQQSEPDLSSMRTTIVVLVAENGAALWAHAGDSRLYWFRGGRTIEQTSDHSVPQRLADAGEIAPEAIRFHEDRNRLLRSLGAKPEPGATYRKEPAAIEPGDAFLLCSDGFWEWVTEPEMEQDLASATTSKQWLDKMVERVQARAVADSDNYTAIAIRTANVAAPAAPENVV